MKILLSTAAAALRHGRDPAGAALLTWSSRAVVGFGLTILLVCTAPMAFARPDEFGCAPGLTLSTGDPDRSLFSAEASPGVRAFWCERYDALGNAVRSGAYWETYPDGSLRSRARYVDSTFDGPVRIHHEDGGLFVRGYLENGAWTGAFEIFFPNGVTWFEATFDEGLLEGPVRTRYPDGALESEAWWQAGHEHGLARSFYPSAAGGQLKSEAHLEDDELVGAHRLFDPSGALVRWIEWDLEPVASGASGSDQAWAEALPTTRRPGATTLVHDLRD